MRDIVQTSLQIMQLILSKKPRPTFFCYLRSMPHTPLQYRTNITNAKDIDPLEDDPKLLPTADINEKSDEDARKVYAMVSNIDDNLNRLFVEALGLRVILSLFL